MVSKRMRVAMVEFCDRADKSGHSEPTYVATFIRNALSDDIDDALMVSTLEEFVESAVSALFKARDVVAGPHAQIDKTMKKRKP